MPGIGKKRVEKIRESWEKQKDIKNVMLFLQQYGVSTAYAAKIYRKYGKESIDQVKETLIACWNLIRRTATSGTMIIPWREMCSSWMNVP